jgi:hypothetical protein
MMHVLGADVNCNRPRPSPAHTRSMCMWDLQNLPEDVEARLPINRMNTGGERIS